MADCITERKDLWSGEVVLLENEQIAEDTWKVAVDAPEFAPLAKAGQFLMLRLPNCSDPILGRPFAVFDAQLETGRVEAVYAVVGKATTRMTQLAAGQKLELWGPLGNGWSAAKRSSGPKRLALVAGGVGSAPFYLLVKELMANPESERPETTYVFGARSERRLNSVDDFQKLGVDVKVVTEDGSVGVKGLVTDVLPEIFPETLDPQDAQVLACGPVPMLRAVAKWCAARGYECWTSLETPMACGLGICFSCVVDWKTDDGTWDYKRTCVDGPVFDASRLKWD